jgi:hypothetical protein
MLPTLQSLAPGCCKCSPQMLSNVYITVQDQGCCACGPAGSEAIGSINQCQPSSPPSSPCTPVVQAQPVAPPPSVIVEAGPPGPPGTPGKDGVDGKPGTAGGNSGLYFMMYILRTVFDDGFLLLEQEPKVTRATMEKLARPVRFLFVFICS